ncbi:MAG: phosphoribosylglycinamide formyltransferase, partial [Christensenellaceae bacterium]
MLKFAVMVSGGGTDLQSLIDATQSGKINAEICCVIASKPDIYAITRAKNANIPVKVIVRRDFEELQKFDQAILNALHEVQADFVVLAGYLNIVGKKTIKAYRNKILNIHPSLIPSFCGMGYYGSKVHESVIAYGAKVSGATVHFVNEKADAGAIILQKAVEVKNDDTPETLQRRVMEQAEWEILPKAV